MQNSEAKKYTVAHQRAILVECPKHEWGLLPAPRGASSRGGRELPSDQQQALRIEYQSGRHEEVNRHRPSIGYGRQQAP